MRFGAGSEAIVGLDWLIHGKDDTSAAVGSASRLVSTNAGDSELENGAVWLDNRDSLADTNRPVL